MISTWNLMGTSDLSHLKQNTLFSLGAVHTILGNSTRFHSIFSDYGICQHLIE